MSHEAYTRVSHYSTSFRAALLLLVAASWQKLRKYAVNFADIDREREPRSCRRMRRQSVRTSFPRAIPAADARALRLHSQLGAGGPPDRSIVPVRFGDKSFLITESDAMPPAWPRFEVVAHSYEDSRHRSVPNAAARGSRFAQRAAEGSSGGGQGVRAFKKRGEGSRIQTESMVGGVRDIEIRSPMGRKGIECCRRAASRCTPIPSGV